ncbi:MAG: glycosyltransferase family 2 protein [Clostridia bacterium]|nr:glycosyltransferase family 2 protein [Clostridia bacterium]
MQDNYKISACVVTYNNSSCAKVAVESVVQHTKSKELCMYVCDNNSTDNTLKTLKEIDGVSVIKLPDNLGFGKAHNAVLDKIDSKYHAVINPDIRIDSDVLSSLAEYLDNNPDVVMVTPKILNDDGTVQHLPKKTPSFKYVFLGRLGSMFGCLKKYREEYTRSNEQLTAPTEVDFCTGCFFLIRTDVFKKLGGFDDNFFMYFEDADLARRAKQFGKVMFVPEFSVTHLWERASSKSIKYLFIHLISYFKYMHKWRRHE